MRQFKVLETNILHASDVIYWLDGTSAENESNMLRLSYPMQIALTTRPADLQLLNTAGKTALWRRPTESIVDGIATDSDLAFPVGVQYPLAGTVSDPDGRYIPRKFTVNAGNASRLSLVLYPTPQATQFTASGGVLGTLRFSSNNHPVPWALLTLSVSTALGATLTFRAQANANGDFMIPLNRVPPLPEGISNYSAELEILALLSADPEFPVDPEDLQIMNLGQLDSDNTFSNPIGFEIVPGEIKLIRSMNKDHLAVQPS